MLDILYAYFEVYFSKKLLNTSTYKPLLQNEYTHPFL